MSDLIEPVVLNLTMPAKDENISIIRSDLSILAREFGFNKEEEEDMTISVGEACVNVIRHAYEGNRSSPMLINIRYWLYSNKVSIVVKDYGKGFDSHFVQSFIQGSSATKPEKKIGLGIFLIKALMDEVKYESRFNEGTSVTMVKHKLKN